MPTLALALWPFIAGILFGVTRLQVALVATIIGGFLLLPPDTAVDMPMLPALDKQSVPSLTALVLTLVVLASGRDKAQFAGQDILRGWVPRSPAVLMFLAFLVFGSLGTVAFNPDPLVYGPVVVQGLRFYDAMSYILEVLVLLVPFLLARKFLASPSGQKTLLTGIVVAATAYAFLALYEVRMSPQLNNMVYGFFPHSWLQHYRGGGWRPLVFLGHGLVLGIFLTVALISATGLAVAATEKIRLIWLLIAVWLFGTLVLAKSVGALMIAVLMLAILLFLPWRLQIVTAVSIACCVLIYPVLRASGLAPVEQVLSLTEKFSAERAQSFEWRIDNEQMLLEKANQRPLFGWGGWGRSRVYSEISGDDLSTTDGFWIIVLGIGGWVRYIGMFGLLTWGIVGLIIHRKSRLDPISATMILVLAGNLIDLIPNAGVTPLTWMLAGALCGRLERGTIAAGETVPDAVDPQNRKLTYARRLPEPAARSADRRRVSRLPGQAGERQNLPYRRKF